MSWNSNRACEIASNSAWRHMCCDSDSFATARAAGSQIWILRMIGSAKDWIVGGVVHRHLGRVSLSENDRAGSFQTRNRRGVTFRHMIALNNGTTRSSKTCRVYRVLDCQWYSV